MYCPLKFNECHIDCALVAVTEKGFGCCLALLAVNTVEGIGVNLEDFESLKKPVINVVEEKDEVSEL